MDPAAVNPGGWQPPPGAGVVANPAPQVGPKTGGWQPPAGSGAVANPTATSQPVAAPTQPTQTAPPPGAVAAAAEKGHNWWEVKGSGDSGGVSNTQFLENAAQGAKQAIITPIDTIEHAVRKVPMLGDWLNKHGLFSDQQIAADDAIINRPIGTGGGLGTAAETGAEFAAGDAVLKYLGEGLIGLVKGANYAEKLKVIAPVLKVAAEHPAVAKVLTTAVRQAGVGTGQGLLHGEDLPTAATEGAITGLVGGATEGGMEALQAGRKGAADAAAATAAHEAAPGVIADKTAAMTAERQSAAQTRVKDVAKDAARGSIDRFNEAQAPPLAKTGEPIGEANFEPADAHAAAAATNSFGDAADQIRMAAKPVYEKIDQATGGKFAELQADRVKAFKANDGAAISKADDAIDALLDKTEGVAPADLKAARSAWADSKVLDKLHQATEGAFNGISEEASAQTGIPRVLKGGNSNGGTLQTRIGTLLRKPGMQAQVENVIGKEGVANLYRASHLVSTPELKAATQKLAAEVAAQLPKLPVPKNGKPIMGQIMGGGAGAAVSHVLPGSPWVTAPIASAAGAVVGGQAEKATRFVLNKMVTSPRIGQLMDYAVRNHVAPRTAGALIAAEIQRENQEQ